MHPTNYAALVCMVVVACANTGIWLSSDTDSHGHSRKLPRRLKHLPGGTVRLNTLAFRPVAILRNTYPFPQSAYRSFS